MEQLASKRERCDQRSFHDTILALGSVPLAVIADWGREPVALPTR